jgi:hypothetical protein
MKTNLSAPRLVRIRVIILCLAIAGMAGVELRLGEFLAARLGQTTARQTDSPAAPNVSISDLMAAGR